MVHEFCILGGNDCFHEGPGKVPERNEQAIFFREYPDDASVPVQHLGGGLGYTKGEQSHEVIHALGQDGPDDHQAQGSRSGHANQTAYQPAPGKSPRHFT